MDIWETMRSRHSVRSYADRPLEDAVLTPLRAQIDACNKQSGLHIQLFLEEPAAFGSGIMRYGSFENVRNYIAMVGKKSDGIDETVGYYGEKIVLCATKLGLGTCWVAATYNKGKCAARVAPDEKLVCVIALGYAQKDGAAHKTKRIEQLCRVDGPMPHWFRKGMEAAQLAPTGLNQQNFRFTLHGDTVEAKAGIGPYTKLDLGIVKYHFELGAGTKHFHWA